MITFRGRKSGDEFDAMFFVHTTNSKAIFEHADLSRYMVGDKLSVCFGDMRLMIQDINEHGPQSIAGKCAGDFLQIPCAVVERSWAMQWKQTGALSELSSCALVLEAVSGSWEDVLLWAVCGKIPEWLPDEDEDEDATEPV